MTEPETPKHSRRRRAIVIAAVVTGVSILLADSAGFRTTVRESLAEIGVAPPVANFAYFLGGALCFGIIFQLAFMWLTSREVLVEGGGAGNESSQLSSAGSSSRIRSVIWHICI